MKHQHATGVGIGPRCGRQHHFWNETKGKYIGYRGYIYVRVERPDGSHEYQREHVVVAEKMIGRRLRKGECVHHKDENRQNNSPDNLQVMTLSEHTTLHKLKELAERPAAEKNAASETKRMRQPSQAQSRQTREPNTSSPQES